MRKRSMVPSNSFQEISQLNLNLVPEMVSMKLYAFKENVKNIDNPYLLEKYRANPLEKRK